MRRTGRPGKVTASPRGIARWVISMDRLLRRLLTKFVRRGTMLFTTADGETFTCGDGTGEPGERAALPGKPPRSSGDLTETPSFRHSPTRPGITLPL